MVTLRRVYLYTVLAISLVLVTIGTTELLRLVIDGIGGLLGAAPITGAGPSRDDLSRTIALLVVATPLWAIHAWLVGRTSRGSGEAASDERASATRAIYFLLVLVVSLVAWSTALSLELLLLIGPTDEIGPNQGGLISTFIVLGLGWVAHMVRRQRDLGGEPERMAGDVVTRVYLYGVLYVAALVVLVSTSTVLTSIGRWMLGVDAVVSANDLLRVELSAPLSMAIVAVLLWIVHWRLAGRLLHADDPMGASHRTSRTRTGYLLAVVTSSAVAILLLVTSSLSELLVALVAPGERIGGTTRLVEDVGGGLVAAVPFLLAWWWHQRRAAREAATGVGARWREAVVRAGRLLVAAVGLGGLAIGVAVGIDAFLELVAIRIDRGVIAASVLRDQGAGSAALATVSLAIWAPAWWLLGRERAQAPLTIARATARRAYLVLVSGTAVIVAMLAGAWLVFQATLFLLGSDVLGDASTPVSVTLVALVVIAYHLLALRADVRLVRDAEAEEAEGVRTERPTTSQQVRIDGPVDVDWEAVIATLRDRLPSGFELHVVPGPDSRGPRDA